MSIQEHVNTVKETIAAAARAAGRDPGEITLCAATKVQTDDTIRQAIAAGIAADVGIPADLKAIVKEEDLDFLSESAFADACCPGNPRDTSVAEIKELYKSLM